jgi:hypothetical protein
MKYCLHDRERHYENMARKEEETTREEDEAAHYYHECPPRLTAIAAETIQQWTATAMDRLFSFTATIQHATDLLLALAGQIMGGLGDLAQLVSDQAFSCTYQALEAAAIVYAVVAHLANNENPNSTLARHNFIWADLTDPRYNDLYANNNNIDPCQLEKYHLGFPFGDMAVGQQFLDHAADNILPGCIIVPPVQTTFDESPTQWDRIIAAALLRCWTVKPPATATITREELHMAIRTYLEARERQKLGVFAEIYGGDRFSPCINGFSTGPRPTEAAFGLDHEDCHGAQSCG